MDTQALKKEILFRCRRGMKEMDLITDRFKERELESLPASELAPLRDLLLLPDQDLFAWITDDAPVPSEHDTPVFHKLKSCRSR